MTQNTLEKKGVTNTHETKMLFCTCKRGRKRGTFRKHESEKDKEKE